MTEVRPGRKEKPAKVAHGWEPVGGVGGKPDGSFVGQSIDHLVGIGSGLHEVNGIPIDLPTDFDAEIAVSADIGAGIGSRDSVRIGFPRKLDFDIVSGDGSQSLAIPESERSRKMFGIDAHVKSNAVTIGHDVVRAGAQDEQSGDREGEKDFFHGFAFQ